MILTQTYSAEYGGATPKGRATLLFSVVTPLQLGFFIL